MIKAAYLRVYLPADRVSSVDRPHPSRRTRVVRVTDHFVWDESLAEDAFSVQWDGSSYLCPRFPRLRMLESALAFSNSYPGLPLISEAGLRSYADELDGLRRVSPDARSYILSSPWHVPLRWFSAFEPGERELYEGGHGLCIRYRTSLASAAERTVFAVTTLEEAGFSDGVVDQVRDLERWLGEFSSSAMLELDYAGVASLFDESDLVLDESCEEVRKSLEALDRGHFEEAGEFYMAVAGRWAHAQSLMFMN
jgi:hypothetical protein